MSEKPYARIIESLMPGSDKERGKALGISYKSIQRLKERLPDNVKPLVENAQGRAVLRAIIDMHEEDRAA